MAHLLGIGSAKLQLKPTETRVRHRDGSVSIETRDAAGGGYVKTEVYRPANAPPAAPPAPPACAMSSSDSGDDSPDPMAAMHSRMAAWAAKKPKPETILSSFDVPGIASHIREHNAKNIIVMTGAGLSTAAGIPDFRTPGTGLYDNLEKYGLPSPQAIFSIDFLRQNPKPFFVLAKELFPGAYEPTMAHHFIALLEAKGLLLRLFTQNIDTLERLTGLPGDKIVEAHGSFAAAHCIDCGRVHTQAHVKSVVFADGIPTCLSPDCGGIVKPDIVFFGEDLPRRFHERAKADFAQCDLLIVMGTSLQVQPFASLVAKVPPSCPRLLLNREPVGTLPPEIPHPALAALYGLDAPFLFLPEHAMHNWRDAAHLGDCDEGVRALCGEMGWQEDLDALCETAAAARAATAAAGDEGEGEGAEADSAEVPNGGAVPSAAVADGAAPASVGTAAGTAGGVEGAATGAAAPPPTASEAAPAVEEGAPAPDPRAEQLAAAFRKMALKKLFAKQ